MFQEWRSEKKNLWTSEEDKLLCHFEKLGGVGSKAHDTYLIILSGHSLGWAMFPVHLILRTSLGWLVKLMLYGTRKEKKRKSKLMA